MKSQRSRAAAAFAALRTLDGCAAERAELAAAGVNVQRIAALYPGEFAAIAAELGERLPSSRSLMLSETISRCETATTKVCAGLDNPLFRLTLFRLSLEDQPDADARKGLGRLLDSIHPINVTRITPTGWQPSYTSQIIVEACWWAWWTMTHRAELPWHRRRHADSLMLVVADLFHLAPPTRKKIPCKAS